MRSLALVAMGLVLCGCPIDVSDSNDGVRITFSALIRILLVAVPALLVAAFVFVARRRAVRVPALLGAGGVAAVAAVLIPGIVLDEVRITSKEIVQTTGFWFAPTVKGFRFDDVDHVRIVRKQTGRHVQNVWEIHERDGRVRDIDPGDLWDHNAERIQPLLESRGVRFQR